MPSAPPSTTEEPLPDQGANSEGVDSYRSGLPLSECPYPPNSIDREVWRKGWNEAACQDNGEGPPPERPPQQTFDDVPLGSAVDPERHPTIDSVNALLAARLSTTEKACRRIAVWTGAPVALLAAIVLQLVWIGVGLATHWDPYPFVFLLTCSNVLQLILIFVIAVAQRQSALHDELRAEADHGAISRLLYHQQAQELLLVRLAEKLEVDTCDLTATLTRLARNGSEGRPAKRGPAEGDSTAVHCPPRRAAGL